MSNLSTLTLLYDDHYWANANCLKACEVLALEQWDKPLGHSWGSVHGVLVHMLFAETLWLSRWLGAPTSSASLPWPKDLPTLPDVRRAWGETESQMRAFIGECTDSRLQSEVNYTTSKGVAYANPLIQLVLQVVNHGMHHRGELAAMLASLAVPHPEDDLIYYLREKDRLSRSKLSF